MATFRSKLQLSQSIAIPLSIVMIVSGCLAFVDVPELLGKNPPIFTTTRHPDTGEHFQNLRRRNSPFWLYQVLHTAPAILWCVMMPIQHIDRVRKKWPSLHRLSGYIILSISLLLNLSGLPLLGAYEGHTNPGFLYLHSFHGKSPIPWPNFRLTTALLTFPYLYSLYRAAVTARAKDFEKHRQWAIAHTICAYTISLERFSLMISYIIAWTITIYTKFDLRKLLSYEDTVASKAAAERDAFALMNVMALVLALTWVAYEWGRKGYIYPLVSNWSKTTYSSFTNRAKGYKVE